MNDDSTMNIISIVIAAVVLLCYGVAFFLSFYKSYVIEKQVINGESIDRELTDKLVKDSENYFKLVEDSINEEGQSTDSEGKTKVPYTFEEYRKRRNRSKRVFSIIMDVVYILIFIVLIAVDVVGIYFRMNNKPIWFGDKSFLVIETGSMSSVDSSNQTALTNAGLESDKFRIPSKTLIKIEKIKNQEDLHKNDVCAYYSEDRSQIIVHRIVDIRTGDNDIKYFSFKGDANNSATTWESQGTGAKDNVCEKNYGLPLVYPSGTGSSYAQDGDEIIIGRYFAYDETDAKDKGASSMWSSETIGFVLSYVKSDLGILCISSAFLVLLLYFTFENASSSRQNKREAEVVKLIDEGKDVRYKWYNVEYRANKRYELLTDDIYIDRM